MTWHHVEDRILKARKRHLCGLCGQPIEVNWRYLSRFGFDDDGPMTSRMHVSCEQLTKDWDAMDWETHLQGDGEWPRYDPHGVPLLKESKP